MVLLGHSFRYYDGYIDIADMNTMNTMVWSMGNLHDPPMKVRSYHISGHILGGISQKT